MKIILEELLRLGPWMEAHHEWYGTKQQMVIDELTAEKEAHATTRKEVKKAMRENDKLARELRTRDATIRDQAETIAALQQELKEAQERLREKDDLEALVEKLQRDLDETTPIAARVPGLETEVASLERNLREEISLHKRVLNVHATIRQEIDQWESRLRESLLEAGTTEPFKVLVTTLLETLPRGDFFDTLRDPHRASYMEVHRSPPRRGQREIIIKHDPARHYTSRAGGWVAPPLILSPDNRESQGSFGHAHTPQQGPLYSPPGSGTRPTPLAPGPCSPAGKATLGLSGSPFNRDQLETIEWA